MEVYSWEHHLFLWAISHGYISHNQRVIQISALSHCPGDRTRESYGSIAEGRTSQLRCHSSPCARARQVGSWKIASGPGDSTPCAINRTYSCIGCWKINPFLVGHWGRFMFFLTTWKRNDLKNGQWDSLWLGQRKHLVMFHRPQR